MIERARLKRLIAQGLAAAGALGVLGVLVLVTRLSVWPGIGAETVPALHEVAELPLEADRLVTWVPDTWSGVRQLEPATRIMMEAAYVRAWAALGRYGTTGDTGPIEATFAEPGRSAALAMPRDGTAGSWPVGHRLQLLFYALDGMTVALRDVDAEITRSTVSGGMATVMTMHEQFDVVMVLEDGYWLVQHLRRTGTGPAVVVGTGSGSGQPTVLAGATPQLMRPVPTMNGVGYVPPDWPASSAEQLTADLAVVAGLGLDTVRVALPYSALGGPDLDPAALDGVNRLLDLAAVHRLHVVLVLFSGLDELGLNNWAATDRHLQTLVAGLSGHPALVMWDIAEQPDRRISDAANQTEITAWVVHTTTKLRAIDPVRPLTVSWGGTAAAVDPAVNGLVDAVSIAWDGPVDDLPAALRSIGQNAAGRPVILSRYGLSTYNGVFPGGHTEAEQHFQVAKLIVAARQAGIKRLCYDQLRDSMTTAAASRLPWRAGEQSRRGLLRRDGSAKAAAALVGPHAEPVRVNAPGLLEPVRKPFSWLVVTVVAVVGVGWLVRRRRNHSAPGQSPN